MTTQEKKSEYSDVLVLLDEDFVGVSSAFFTDLYPNRNIKMLSAQKSHFTSDQGKITPLITLTLLTENKLSSKANTNNHSLMRRLPNQIYSRKTKFRIYFRAYLRHLNGHLESTLQRMQYRCEDLCRRNNLPRSVQAIARSFPRLLLLIHSDLCSTLKRFMLRHQVSKSSPAETNQPKSVSDKPLLGQGPTLTLWMTKSEIRYSGLQRSDLKNVQSVCILSNKSATDWIEAVLDDLGVEQSSPQNPCHVDLLFAHSAATPSPVELSTLKKVAANLGISVWSWSNCNLEIAKIDQMQLNTAAHVVAICEQIPENIASITLLAEKLSILMRWNPRARVDVHAVRTPHMSELLQIFSGFLIFGNRFTFNLCDTIKDLTLDRDEHPYSELVVTSGHQSPAFTLNLLPLLKQAHDLGIRTNIPYNHSSDCWNSFGLRKVAEEGAHQRLRRVTPKSIGTVFMIFPGNYFGKTGAFQSGFLPRILEFKERGFEIIGYFPYGEFELVPPNQIEARVTEIAEEASHLGLNSFFIEAGPTSLDANFREVLLSAERIRLQNGYLDFQSELSFWRLFGKSPNAKRFFLDLKNHKLSAIFVNYVKLTPILEGYDFSDIPKVCEIHDIHWTLKRLYSDQSPLIDDIEKEISLLSQFDGLISVSELESNYLRHQNIVKPIITLPQLLDHISPPDAKKICLESKSEICDLFFVSSWHRPNYDGFIWFMEKVYKPFLKDMNLLIFVAGDICKPLSGLNLDANIKLLGRVDNLSDYYARSKIALAPVRGGTGVGTKTLEATAMRRPIVATSDALRGIEWIFGQELCHNSAEAFAKRVIELLNSEKLREECAYLWHSKLECARATLSQESRMSTLLKELGIHESINHNLYA